LGVGGFLTGGMSHAYPSTSKGNISILANEQIHLS
jgi:hypothetical protein